MSWEKGKTIKHKCPCGKGTYSIHQFSDDWNRFEEQWEMDCTNCKREYILYPYRQLDSGLILNKYRWIKKKSNSKVQAIQKKFNRVEKEILKIAEKQYKVKWVSSLTYLSKKKIWKILTDNGKRYPSLQTFYSHVKVKTLKIYLQEHFTIENLPLILKSLKLSNKEIHKKLNEAERIKREFQAAKSRMIKDGFA